jgi:hypothetical protein
VLDSLPWLVHGFSTRQGGASTCYGGKTLNLGLTSHDSNGAGRWRALSRKV